MTSTQDERLASARPGAAGSRFAGVGLPLLSVVVLLGLNMRTIVASLPPLLGDVRDDLGLSAGVGGLLTTLPVICFGALAPLAPRLARRVSLERLLLWCAAVTAVAAGLRGVGGAAGLFAGTVLSGVAIAIGQAALPVLIRTVYPQATGLLMGAYSMALTLGATIAAAIAVPLEDAFGGSWAGSLAFWALPAALAAILWWVVARGGDTRLHGSLPVPMRRERLSWWVALYFGVQGMAFYAGLAWLPEILEDGGWSEGGAGGLQALLSLVSIVPAFAVPMLAARAPQQTLLLVWIVVLSTGGAAGLLLAPGAAILWIVLLGVGQGGALGLGLFLPMLRAGSPEAVASMTAMALCVGYLIAAAGPYLMGLAHDLSGDWDVPLVVLAVMSLVQLWPGWPASRAGVVDS